jgi:hypothetical protein
MAHSGLQPTWTNVSMAHEHGDVEQSHHRFKEAVEQAFRVRASRDFASRAAYEHCWQNLMHKRNQTSAQQFSAEKASLRPLPSRELAPCKELRVVVSQFSTITVATTRSSVPSRLMGTTMLVRVRSEHLEGYGGTTRVFAIPRLLGKHHHRIDYHHVIHALVRKAGAFAAYRYRHDLFPTTTFRQAYDCLGARGSERAERDYVRILPLAATTAEAEVATALQMVREAGKMPLFVTVRDLVQVPTMRTVPALSTPDLNFASSDQLIPSARRACVSPHPSSSRAQSHPGSSQARWHGQTLSRSGVTSRESRAQP